MRGSHFFLSVATFTVIISIITAALVIDAVEKSLNPRTVNANNLVKRQSGPSCSTICGVPDPVGCSDIPEDGAQFCDTTILAGSLSDDCNISYQATPDGTCTNLNDFGVLTQQILSACLSQSSPSGGCVDAPNGARVCVFGFNSPCH